MTYCNIKTSHCQKQPVKQRRGNVDSFWVFLFFFHGLVLVVLRSDLSEEKSYFRKLEHCWKGVVFATKSDYFVFRKALF